MANDAPAGRYADAAAKQLQDAARAAYRVTFEAGSKLARLHSAVQRAGDVVEVMGNVIDLIIAAEAIEQAGKDAVQALRNELRTVMDDTGATGIKGTHHRARLQQAAVQLEADEPEKTPPEYVVLTPRYERDTIRHDLKRGKEVAGWSLRRPNHQTLVIERTPI